MHKLDIKSPIVLLMNEHEIITSAIDIAMKADSLIGKNDELYSKVARNLLSFFRNYADNVHHKKEDNILFPEMIRKNEMMKEGVLKEMNENHHDFHDMINNAEQYLIKGDYLRAQQQLHVYADALLDHIAVENEEVFQIAASIFDDNELETMYFRFIDIDRETLKPELETKLEQIRNLF